MARKPFNGLPSLAKFLSESSSRPWWEKFLFPRRFERRLAERLLRVFEIGFYRNFTAYELARDLGMDSIDGQCALDEAIRHLLLKGKIEQPYPGKFCLHDYRRITGVVDLSQPDKPLLISGNYRLPVYILPERLLGASHGDTVSVKIRRRAPHSLEAEVVSVIKFAQRHLVGNLEVLEHRAYFTPVNRELFRTIVVPLNCIKNAENGDRVLVELQPNGHRRETIAAKVIKILGEADTEYVETQTLLQRNNFAQGFSPEEEEAAAAIRFDITPADIASRLDLRGVPTFTIDPDGTKDVDDALSIRPLPEGNWEIGIHIADVTHYIKPGSILDKHAYKYTTSVYLPDRVLPLFPDTVTHGCSLFPGRDKLAFSVLFEIDDKARVRSRKVAKTLIRSQRQFTYAEAQELLDGGAGEFAGELRTLYALSKKLRRGRFLNGAITFSDRPELYFEFDGMGKVIGVRPHKRLESMKLIEEFMLLANRNVAEIAARKRMPFVYRTHGLPNKRMFDELRRVAANYGHTLNGETAPNSTASRTIAKSISHFLSHLEGEQEEMLFINLSIRSMACGKYSPVPRRHFALSFDHYTHFTSPIRRYMDMVVHRLLTNAFIDYSERTYIFNYETACQHFNFMREKAKALEDAMDRQKAAEFLSDKVGREFEGTVTHVSPTTLSVTLDDSGIRGRVLLKTLLDDSYELDVDQYIIQGKMTGHFYRIGHKVTVRVVHVDSPRAIVDFVITNHKLSKKTTKLFHGEWRVKSEE
ncbi:MAG: VacB/RNase II family 3'-5' exoribonuclease [Prevotellaceae bacterium]|jgi:ribonuclease R|nr:VacB/RNase II family 3'-5' exoribonuclease [Prevotellaceae bacterium]